MSDRIAIIAADYPKFISGYSGYNFNLVNSLIENDVEVFLFTSKHNLIEENKNIIKIDWSISGIIKIIRQLKYHNIKIINLQYPNLLYGRINLIPNLLVIILRMLGCEVSTTIHEYSNINFIRRIFQSIFFIASNKIIVTTEFEKEKLIKSFGFVVKKKIRLVNIGSNIKSVNFKPNFNVNTIIYFGMFYPDKQLKETLEKMVEIDKQFPNKFNFKIIGIPHDLFPKYYDECLRFSNQNLSNVEWLVGISDEEIEEQIKNTFCAILSFNDGASLRRGSLLACLVNGIPVISNKASNSFDLSDYENRGLFFPDDDKSIQEIIIKLKADESLYSECFENLKALSDNFNFKVVAKNYTKALFGSPKI